VSNHTGLKKVLKEDFQLHGARLNFMSRFIMAVIVVRTVSLGTLASALNPIVFPESNEKRLKRFFQQISLSKTDFAKLMLKLIPHSGKHIVSLDRTNWQIGNSNINIMMLAVCHKGIAFPLIWTLLDKKGNSKTRERLDLLDELLKILPAIKIEVIVADREFIGKLWFKGLRKRKVSFVMRIKNDTLIASKGSKKSVKHRYNHLKIAEVYVCPKRVSIYGLRFYLAVTKSQEGEIVAVACNDKAKKALSRYAQRWNIECLFSALKTRGFNLEDTKLTQVDRLNNIIILLSIAFAWAHLLGEWVYSQRPLKLKKHGYLPISFFKRGLNYLRTAILAQQSQPAKIPLSFCLNLLSP